MGILQLAEQGIDHYPSGVIHCKQQCELRSIFSQPSVVAAVCLNQHTLTRHPLPPNAVLRRATPTRTVYTGGSQYLAQRVATDVYALPFPEQLAQVRMVDSGVSAARQTYYIGRQCARCSVGRAATSIAVS